jgi:HEAT repeat protein
MHTYGVPTSSRWGRTPRQSVVAECGKRGQKAVVEGCIALLAGRETEPELIFALGGPPARWAVEGGAPGPDYWLRVWAARGLLWVWDDDAAPYIIAALSDDAWRVREIAVKVARRHELVDAVPVLIGLRDDPNARVSKAAEQAVARLRSN